MRSSGPFCPIQITHSARHGVRVWAVRDPKYRVDGRGVLVDHITSQDSFESNHMRLSWYVPTTDLIYQPTERV